MVSFLASAAKRERLYSVLKVREGLAVNDYRDPGPYKHAEGTFAYEFKGPRAEPARRS